MRPIASGDGAEQVDVMHAPDAPSSVGGVNGDATNFVLFDFRALTTFDERKPYVLTLAESGGARLLLVMLRAGQSLAPQPLASETSAQALRGRLRLTVGGGVGLGVGEAPPGSVAATELRAGRLALIEAHTGYRFDALSDAVVLLSLTPSPGEVAPDDPLRGAAGPLVTRGAG